MDKKHLIRKWLAVGIILLFVGTCIIPTTAKNLEKLSSSASKVNSEIACFDTILEIKDLHAGIGKITAEIKNVGE